MTRWHKALEAETPIHTFERRMTARLYIVGVIIVLVLAFTMWMRG